MPARKNSEKVRSIRGRMPSGAPNPIDVHVGGRIRLRRTMLGISQDLLGQSVGLTFQQVQKYERGANRISASRLFELARALDTSVTFFFQGMSEEVEAASPRNILSATEDPPSGETEVMARRETVDLIRTYFRISDPAIRRRVLELAEALGMELNRAP